MPVCMFACTYWEALCDGDLDIEEKNPGSEPSTDPNWLFGITDHTANTGKRQVISKSSHTRSVHRLYMSVDMFRAI